MANADRRRAAGSARNAARSSYPRELRIIGGRWRGRKLAVSDAEGLRPTPDRVRETVFNWLSPYLEGAHCLDLFAGTGALCLEALSRGAGRVVMVEKSPAVVQCLRRHVEKLHAENAEVILADAMDFLHESPRPFDIVFIDPPFRSDLVARSLAAVIRGGWLKPDGLVYLEMPSRGPELALPPGFELIRSKKAGQVGYHLARKTTNNRDA